MGSRRPAPGRLAVAQAFLNSVDLEARNDELASAEDLGRWLAGHDLLAPDTVLDADDLSHAIQVREALRDLLESHHATPPRPPATGFLREIAEKGRLVTAFHAEGGGGRLEATAPGLDGALGNLIAIVHTAMADGTWYRLKVCQRDKCRWAFYDHSKNRSSTWCSMDVCGNKEKAAAYRRRHMRA